MSTTGCRKRSNRVTSAPLTASTPVRPSAPLINNFVTNPWSVRPRENHSQPLLDPAILTPMLSHLDRKSIVTMMGLSRASWKDETLKSQLQSVCDAMNQKMISGLIAFFDAIQKFFISRPTTAGITVLIAIGKPEGASCGTRWSWMIQKRAYIKVDVERDVYKFERPLDPGFTRITYKQLRRHLPNRFTVLVGKEKLQQVCKSRKIFIYMHVGDSVPNRLYGFRLLYWILKHIPSASYSVENGFYEITIPFDESSTFSPIHYNDYSASLQQTPPVRNVLEGDRRIRSIIDREPYMNTSTAQRLLSTGEVDLRTSHIRDTVNRRIATLQSGGGNRKITGKSRAAA